MDEHKTYSISAENICCGKLNLDEITVSGGEIMPPPKPQSILWIGDKYYRTSLPVDQPFNWFQKMMWKWCFGIKVENYIEV